MTGVSGYIAHNEDTGEPYMGLLIQDSITQTNWFIASKSNGRQTVDSIVKSLNKLVRELEKTPSKLVQVKGDLNGTLRGRQG